VYIHHMTFGGRCVESESDWLMYVMLDVI
jgi:hypothetical protein